MDAIGIAGSGLNVSSTWLNAISDNIANANDVTSTSASAFQERFVVATEAASGGGVQASAELGSATGKVVSDPTNTLADKDGNVRTTDIDMSQQMSDMIMAQRAYQANAQVVTQAKSVYQAALAIGRN
jgi:flagellar basal-body rod protein FlgC